MAERLPKGSVEYNMLGPGAHLKPHCGPSNYCLRILRIHLPIVLPGTIQENEQVRMIVAGDGDPPGPTATATATGSESVAVARSRQEVVDSSNTSRAWVAGRATIFDDSYEVRNSVAQHSTAQHWATLGLLRASCMAVCFLVATGLSVTLHFDWPAACVPVAAVCIRSLACSTRSGITPMLLVLS